MGIFSRKPDRATRHAIEDLQRDVRRLNEDLESLRTQHLKLRGTVYAAKRYAKVEEEEDPKPAQLTRDELKRSLVQSGTFIPGRPAVHK